MMKRRPLVAISVAPAHGWNFVDPSADRRQAQAQFEYPSLRWPSRIFDRFAARTDRASLTAILTTGIC